jgi:hypothetical protein
VYIELSYNPSCRKSASYMWLRVYTNAAHSEFLSPAELLFQRSLKCDVTLLETPFGRLTSVRRGWQGSDTALLRGLQQTNVIC